MITHQFPLFYNQEHGWLFGVPEYPSRRDAVGLREQAKQPFIVDHVRRLLGRADIDEPERLRIMGDFVSGNIRFCLLGPNMNGIGDIRAFNAPIPRERIYSYDKQGAHHGS